MEVSVDGLVQGSGYTISNVGNDNGGNVTFATAPRISGAAAVVVALRRLVPLTQSTNLPTQGALDTDALEAEVDRNVMRNQQLNEVDQRTLKLPIESTLTDVGPPDLVSNGGKFLGVNAGETAVVWGTPAASGALISTFMETVLDDVDSATARGTLGIVARATSAKTAAFSVAAAEDGKLFNCSAASADYAATLLSAVTAGDGFEIIIKKTDATKYMITITPNGSETIDGLQNLKLRYRNSQATLVSDGSNWRIASHENVVIDCNVAENASLLVDQFDHSTRTGVGASSAHLIDRWQIFSESAAPGRWTFSVESNGGVDGRSKWAKWLCTTSDASPAAADAQYIIQSVIGNNLVGNGYLGTDGLFENGVLSMDIIGHLDTPAAPYTGTISIHTQDGTARQYGTTVSIAADATFQRVSIVIPEDVTADFDPGVGQSLYIGLGLYAGSSKLLTDATWENDGDRNTVSGSQNWASATNNYIGITNVKFQPGQILTPFVPRPYEEELDICRDYAEKLSYDGVASEVVGYGVNDSTSIAACAIDYKPKIANATPAITSSAAATFDARQPSVGASVGTSVAFVQMGRQTAKMRLTVTGTPLTGDLGSNIRRDGTDTTWIFINGSI